MPQQLEPWVVDPEDPRAPPQDVWDQLSAEQRQRIVDRLPAEGLFGDAPPPEGDDHTEAVYGVRTALRLFFGSTRRSIYVGTNLPVYYPARAMFSPDVIAVLEVPGHPRSRWVVSGEGKGLDFALDVRCHEDDSRERSEIEEYARLGVREYFVFDRSRRRLQGFRLRAVAPGYEPIIPQHGRFASEVLGLGLRVEGERLRFYMASTALPAADDFVDRLEAFVGDLESRLAAAEQRAEAEGRRADAEARRAELAEARWKHALAELERAKAERR